MNDAVRRWSAGQTRYSIMESEFERFTGFRWDSGDINKNLLKHNVEDWECEQTFFNEPLIVLDDAKRSFSERR